MNKSYKGKLIISTPNLGSDFFSRTVILIIEHNSNGAFGLILNKKNLLASKKLSELLNENTEVYVGGPVEENKAFFIIKGTPISANFLKIDHQFYLTEDREKIANAIGNGHIKAEDLRMYLGYTGWGSQQLEEEMERKSWIVVDDFQIDYTEVGEDLWRKTMQNLGGEYLLWANAPKDISLN